TTVYGYGGPIFEAKNLDKLKCSYVEAFDQYCKDMNVISEFLRFHPVLRNHTFLENFYDIYNIRSTIFMDLSKGEQQIWDSLASNCKRNIKKAQASGISVITGRSQYLLNEF